MKSWIQQEADAFLSFLYGLVGYKDTYYLTFRHLHVLAFALHAYAV